MNYASRSSVVGFILALSALSIPGQASATMPNKSGFQSVDGNLSIESRLTRISKAIRALEKNFPDGSLVDAGSELDVIAGAWGNRGAFANGGGGWANAGGFRNGGGFLNGGGFANGFRNGGGFYNYRY